MRNNLTAILLTALALAGVSAATGLSEKDVPAQAAALLAEKCLGCHNDEKRAGGLDFSTRKAASAAIGAAKDSRLLRAVRDGRMPPSGKLPPDQIALLSDWIANGGRYPQVKLTAETPMSPTLWSFKPVRRPAVPKTPLDHLAVNPIDRFVFRKLLEKGLTPSRPADRLTLIRRVTIDLTGLPPTPSEIDAFLSDRSPAAYEKVVDRLLASSAYGERWARHWLDVVRFGESNGYEQNHLRPNAWPFRDYVIRSFNSDKPYDRFVTEQLAGDVLAKQDPDADAGTGFLVAGIHDTVGIQEEEGTRQQRINDLEDIVSTTGAAFLGLTVGCARCHDHKFDPVPQRDFYRMAAVFAGVRHGERPLAAPPGPEQSRAEVDALQDRLVDVTNEYNRLDASARWRLLKEKGEAGTRPPVAARWNEDRFEAVTARFVRFTVTATNDGTEPCLDELQVFGPREPRNLALAARGAKATASSLFPGVDIHQIRHLNDARFGNEWSWISSQRGAGWAQIELPKAEIVDRVVWSRDGAEIPRFDDRIPTKYHIEVSLDGQNWSLVSSDAGRSGKSDYIHPDELKKAMTEAERDRRAQLLSRIEELKRELPALASQRKAYIGQFTKPEPVYVLRRGDVMQREDTVLPGGLCKIPGLNGDLMRDEAAPEPERRLALACWITEKRNPLTARVMVNRMWQYHFGRGIVGTPSDFGRNGEKPSHPELLDWLADDFVRNGWRMKRLHRMMVTSYTYRQGQTPAASGGKAQAAAFRQNMAKDAGSLYLWRMGLRRMEAEAVRDAVLQTSGKLDRRMGGPGYRLYEYNVVNVAIFRPKEEYGPETWRRGIYSQAARGIRDSFLGTLDCPESSQRAPKRESTTTALQALSLLNGAFTQQQAGFFAERVGREAGATAAARVEHAFRLAFGRRPAPVERKDALSLLQQEGLTALCRALLNANEFLYY